MHQAKSRLAETRYTLHAMNRSSPSLFYCHGGLSLNARAVQLARRARRLHRKRLAETVVAHWKSFAFFRVADLRVRRFRDPRLLRYYSFVGESLPKVHWPSSYYTPIYSACFSGNRSARGVPGWGRENPPVEKWRGPNVSRDTFLPDAIAMRVFTII